MSDPYRAKDSVIRGTVTIGLIILIFSTAQPIFAPAFVPALVAAQRGRMSSAIEDRAGGGTGFVFPRVQYSTSGRRFFGGTGWAHDYPTAEHHILDLVGRLTRIDVDEQSFVIVRLDSEEIFKYPFLYFSEVGEMNLTPREVANFREYLSRGGFAMIDDFYGQAELNWFLSQMKRVSPNLEFVELDVNHSLFHTLYEVSTLEGTSLLKPGRSPNAGRYYGYYGDKDRLLMIINHDNDLGDFWEWLDEPRYPLPETLQGIHLGINYCVYALTH